MKGKSKQKILINTIKVIIHPHTRRHLDGMKSKTRRSSNWAIQYFTFLHYDVWEAEGAELF